MPFPSVDDTRRHKGEFHPFIEGLLKTLPPTGTDWPSKNRAKWLRAAASAFDLIYEGGNTDVKVKVNAGD
jgi:hypothetical protein